MESRRPMVGHMNLRHPSYVCYMDFSFYLGRMQRGFIMCYRFVNCLEAAKTEVSFIVPFLLCF